MLLTNQAKALQHWPDEKNGISRKKSVRQQVLQKVPRHGLQPEVLSHTGVIDNGDGTYRPNDIKVNPEDYWMSVCRNAPSMFIYDNSYIKCREITLTYQFPKKWLGKVVQDMSISFVTRNPFIVWKNIPDIDPDSNYNNTTGMGLEYGSLPSRKSYGFNLYVKF